MFAKLSIAYSARIVGRTLSGYPRYFALGQQRGVMLYCVRSCSALGCLCSKQRNIVHTIADEIAPKTCFSMRAQLL